MTASQSLPASTIVGQTGFIDADVPCRQCGYNLRGLQMSGRCPECGLPIAVSVHGDLLQFSRPQWLETLRLGVLLIIASVIVYIVAMLSGMTGNALVPYLIQLAGTGCFLAGSWLLTTPDPSGLGEDQYGTSRKTIRVSLGIALACTLAEVVADLGGTGSGAVPLRVLIALLGGVANLVGFIATLLYLSKLAMRIPDPDLHRRARFLVYAIGISYAALIAGGIVIALLITGGAGPGAMAAGCFMLVPGVALLVFGLMYLVLLERWARRSSSRRRSRANTGRGWTAFRTAERNRRNEF